MNNKILIGVDPDVTKSGVSVIENGRNSFYNFSFFELFDYLIRKQIDSIAYNKKIVVYVEAGFLNKGNWHVVKGNPALNAQIGQRTGSNHQTAKHIIEMLEYLNIEHVKVKPTKTKLNAEQFGKLTRITQRLNQENRDSFMLIFGK